jgi:hypothetical protein
MDLVGKFEGKRSLGRTRQKWQNNIKMDLKDRDELTCTDLN